VTLALAAGCGPGRAPSSAVPAPAATRKPSAAVASNTTGWQTATGSPEPVSPGSRTTDSLVGPGCQRRDGALDRVALVLAERFGAGQPLPDTVELELLLRQQGAPYVWPRTFARSQHDDPELAAPRLQTWLASSAAVGEPRCGFAVSQHGPESSVAVVAADALADLEPLPLRARVGSWLTLRATMRVPASGAKVVLLGPSRSPRPLPTAFDGQRVSAPFALDRPGRFLVQVLAEVGGGPRPVLEALVFADVEPPARAEPEPAPGEDAADPAEDPARALERMLAKARNEEGLPGLRRDEGLDRVAQSHAEAMRDAGRIGHDLGQGDPAERARAAGLELISAGENVALASSLVLVHRKLFASPSHRANMLSPSFDAVGIGAVRDGSGRTWVCQLFGQHPR
jgi:hypothetical protein